MLWRWLPVFIGLLQVSGICRADNVVSLNKFQLQISASALESSSDGSFSKVNSDGSIVALTQPLCLSMDARSSISYPYAVNSSPLPRLKISSCDASDQSQIFSFNGKLILSNTGMCLTRATSQQVVYDMTEDARTCLTPDYGYASGAMSENNYNTSIRLEACDGSAAQDWSMTTDSVNGQEVIQPRSDGQCLSISGNELDGYLVSTYPTLEICSDINNTVAYGENILTVSNNFYINMGACDASTSQFTLQSSVMQVEKIVPIVIPN